MLALAEAPIFRGNQNMQNLSLELITCFQTPLRKHRESFKEGSTTTLGKSCLMRSLPVDHAASANLLKTHK